MTLNKIELTDEELEFLRAGFVASQYDDRGNLQPVRWSYSKERFCSDLRKTRDEPITNDILGRLSLIESLVIKLNLQED